MASSTIDLVSVITICLNAEGTIRRTIESVLSQTYNNIEYIIIDGCSTDKTIEIINEYKNRISHYISETDEGISDAFNKGINMSTGKFIQITNADDYLPKDKIEKSIELLQQNLHYAYCFGDIILTDKNYKAQLLIKGDPSYHKVIKYFMPRINHPTVLARKSMYNKYGLFNNKWKIGMDYDWLLRLHRKLEIGVYSDSIKVFMQLGGVSDENWVQTQIEGMRISIHNQLNPLLAYFIFVMIYMKTLIRICLEHIVPRQWISYFRPGKSVVSMLNHMYW